MTGQTDSTKLGHDERLPRRLGAPALAMIFVAFSAPLGVLAGYQQLVIAFGNGVGAPLASIAAGVLLIVFTFGCTTMSRHMKSPGAFYCYIAEGLGKPLGLAGALVAGLAYLAITIGSYPYMGLITVNLTKQLFDNQILPWQAWGVITLAVVTGLNLLRIDLSMRVLGTVVALETIVVAIWQVVVFAKGGPEGYSLSSFSWSSFTSGDVGLAILFSLASLIGLESTAVFRAETRDPDRNVPRATYAAITFMSVFYGLGIWAYIVAVGPTKAVDVARKDPVGSFFGSVESYLGSVVSTLVSILLVTSVLAAINSTQGAAARYLYTMGRDRVFWSRLSRVHPTLGSPFVAVLVTATISLVAYLGIISISNDVVAFIAAFTGFGTFCVLCLLLGTSLAVVAFFRRNPDYASFWAGTAAPVVAFVGVAVVLVLAGLNMDSLIGSTVGGYVAVGVVVVVIVVGLLLARRYRQTRPETYRRIGRQDLELSEITT